MENDDLEFPDRDALLAAARRDHPAYYRGASEQDAAALDLLVMLRAALIVGLRFKRPDVPQQVRMGFERTTDAAEQAFLAACGAVRTRASYLALGAKEQAEIQGRLFTAEPVTGE